MVWIIPHAITGKAQKSKVYLLQCGIITFAALCVLCRYRHNTHWVGVEKRLDREQRGRGQDKQAYAFEELVAEIGACFLCIHFGLDPEIEIDHAPYIQNWIEVLENDHKAIFKAAAEAQKAVEFLNEKCELP